MKTLSLLNAVNKMKSDKVSNYVIAGLNSYLLNNGKIRLFESTRDHQDQITPHSHRYDFMCIVLKGEVRNHIWEEVYDLDSRGDLFQVSTLKYDNEIGQHTVTSGYQESFIKNTEYYTEGDSYSMCSDEIHSITFSKGAVVLFLEFETTTEESLILEPVVDGCVIPTYENKEYMFKKEGI